MNDWKLIKLTAPFTKPYRWQLILLMIFLPLSSFTYSMQPLVIQKAVDGPLAKNDFSFLWVYVLVLALAVLVNFFVQVYQMWLVNSIGHNLVTDLREKLFLHLESMPMSFFDKTPVGKSVSRITSDVEQLAESFAGGLAMVILDAFNIVGIFFFMFYLNYKLSILVLISIVPIVFCSIYFQEKYRKANLKSREELAKLNSFLQQNIVGISVVQVLNSAKKSMETFSEGNKKYFKANDDCVKADAQLSAIIEMISFLIIAAMVYFCAKIIFDFDINKEQISIGIILAFLYYTQALFEPLKNLTDRFAIVQSAFTALERIAELFDEEPELKPKSSALILNLSSLNKDEPLIEFKDVWFKYPGQENGDWILRGVSFKVLHGQKVAIIGRTGSGKSTIIKLLTRLYSATKGEIKINGINIDEYAPDDVRRKIAVIHQDSYMFSGDLESNIKLGRENCDLDSPVIKDLIQISNLSLKQKISERAGNISAGEEQLINFARALVTNPEFVILDEATAKIDLKTEAFIQTVLKKYLNGKTSIIIAHRLETIKNSDLVITIENGEVNEKYSQ
jgi:ATP-binding cassette, subfamily B, multidrug efflux pump